MARRLRKSKPLDPPEGAGSNVVVRVRLAMALVILIGIGLFARAVYLQVGETDFLQDQGEARHLRSVEIPTMRGSILDRRGEPLAVSTPVDSVWANPEQALEAPEKIPALARVLNVSAQDLERRLTQRTHSEFVWLRRRITPDVADEVRRLEVPGVGFRREYRRYYPTIEAGAQLVGYTNIDDRGQEGLEMAFDNWLDGAPGRKQVIKDRQGRVVEEVGLLQAMEAGRDLQLTIDRRLQYQAYRELREAVYERQAQSGSVVVMDVSTGEVLAMVNYPSYNPNANNRSVGEGLRNRAMTDMFEPGSVIKPFALAASLESGQVTPNMMIDTSPGTLQVSGHTIRDVRNFGELTITEMLVVSSNVGMVELILDMPPERLWGMYQRFGFGQVTGTGFPGESAGVLRDYVRWRTLEQATLAYGYGLSVTPLQLARAVSAIADQGRLRQPLLIMDDTQYPPQSVLHPTIARQLGDMMEAVVESENGTGRRARIPGYRVAGKTGTSRKSISGGYANRYISSFIGYAPASRPRLAAVVVINDPSGDDYYGGQVAAPIFARVMGAALRLNNVPPDDIEHLMVQTGGAP